MGVVLTEAKTPAAAPEQTVSCGVEGACGGGCGMEAPGQEGGCAASKALAEKAAEDGCDGECEVCDECDKHPDWDGACETCDKSADDQKCDGDCEDCDYAESCAADEPVKDEPAAADEGKSAAREKATAESPTCDAIRIGRAIFHPAP